MVQSDATEAERRDRQGQPQHTRSSLTCSCLSLVTRHPTTASHKHALSPSRTIKGLMQIHVKLPSVRLSVFQEGKGARRGCWRKGREGDEFMLSCDDHSRACSHRPTLRKRTVTYKLHSSSIFLSALQHIPRQGETITTSMVRQQLYDKGDIAPFLNGTSRSSSSCCRRCWRTDTLFPITISRTGPPF